MNNKITPALITTNTIRPWLVVFSAASFFFLTNILLNLNVLVPYLSTDFGFNAKEISFLFACYYYSNILFVFVAGIILNRISPKKILITSFIIANCSTLVFATTKSLVLMAISRLTLGIVGSFSMLICFQLIQNWFHNNKIVIAISITTTYATLGTLLSQTPLMFAIEKLGWRFGIMLNFWLGVILCIFAIKFVQDSPATDNKPNIVPPKTTPDHINSWVSIRKVITNPQNWLIGIYASLYVLPGLFFNANWGILYLQQSKNLTEMASAFIISANIIGSIIGPLLIGWISNKFQTKKMLIVICTLLVFGLVLAITYLTKVSATVFVSLFFLFGIISSSQVIHYPLIAEKNPKYLTNTAIGFVSTLNALSGIYMPFLGWLIDHNSISRCQPYNYSSAMLALIIGMFICIILTGFIKKSDKNV